MQPTTTVRDAGAGGAATRQGNSPWRFDKGVPRALKGRQVVRVAGDLSGREAAGSIDAPRQQ